MNIQSIILLGAILAGLFFAVRSSLRNKSSCGGCCENCNAGGCHRMK